MGSSLERSGFGKTPRPRSNTKDMRHHREIGPTHPLMANFDWAEITFMEDCGRDNDDVINCGPSELPEGYLDRRN